MFTFIYSRFTVNALIIILLSNAHIHCNIITRNQKWIINIPKIHFLRACLWRQLCLVLASKIMANILIQRKLLVNYYIYPFLGTCLKTQKSQWNQHFFNDSTTPMSMWVIMGNMMSCTDSVCMRNWMKWRKMEEWRLQGKVREGCRWMCRGNRV